MCIRDRDQAGASPKGGLRIDCAIHFRNKALWIDATAVHVSCATNRAKEYTSLTNEVLQGTQVYDTDTPAVQARSDYKRAKYLPMLNCAELQTSRRMRSDTVSFTPAVMTHTGQFCKGMLQTIEDLAMEAKRQCIAKPSPIGITPAMASARCRTRIKDELAAAMARGFGGMLRAVGFPTNKTAASADDARY